MPARLRRVVSRLTLAAFFGAFVLPLVAGVHFSWNDDAACTGSPDLGPRHGQSEFATAQPPAEAGHCAVCHWMRAVSGATPRPAVTHLVHFTPRDLQAAVVTSVYADASTLEQPSRAPPISSSI